MTENPNLLIKDFVESDGPSSWKHKEYAKDFYNMAEVMRLYFFSAKDAGDYQMPQPLVGIENLGYRTLACYYLVENPVGLRYQISMNSVYLDRPPYEQYETLCHEMIHLYQENHADLPKCKNGYHNLAFVEIAESIGLHSRLGSGAHWKPADGQFQRLLDRFSIPKPSYSAEAEVPPADKKSYWWDKDRGNKKGSSTLLMYTCKCEPPFKIRSGRSNLTALCKACGSDFELVTKS
ncbi:MAG: SprT-like domain-containing protein [Dehalococcoidia bacterium]|nr:SprT-like domain-containing protein [Dehalococcoidia bacterium]